MSPKKRRKNPLGRAKALIQRDVELLREWALSDTDLELIVFVGDGVSVTHLGRMIEVKWNEEIQEFLFVGWGTRASLFPKFWKESAIETVTGRSLHVLDKNGLHSTLTIRERPQLFLEERKKIIEQFRTWEQLQTELGIQLITGNHAIFLLGRIVALSDGAFSFVQAAKAVQLVITPESFNYAEIRREDGAVFIELASSGCQREVNHIGEVHP